MNVAITTSSIAVVMYVLDRGALLLRIGKPDCGLTEMTLTPCFGRFILLCVTSVIETDIGVTACPISVVNACLSDNLEDFAHFLLLRF